jgi:hypothetical protein
MPTRELALVTAFSSLLCGKPTMAEARAPAPCRPIDS